MAGNTKSPEGDQQIWLHFLGTDVMAEYLNATGKISKALENGEKEVSLPTEFLAKWVPETVRMEDCAVIEAWNQACDAAGFPDQKKPLPEPPTDPMVLNETLPIGHALPLKGRKPEFDDEELPF